jgi:hypothetical protein
MKCKYCEFYVCDDCYIKIISAEKWKSKNGSIMCPYCKKEKSYNFDIDKFNRLNNFINFYGTYFNYTTEDGKAIMCHKAFHGKVIYHPLYPTLILNPSNADFIPITSSIGKNVLEHVYCYNEHTIYRYYCKIFPNYYGR